MKLLKVPFAVKVEEWIRYHHADFGNEYTDIEPYEYKLLSGDIQLNNIKTEEQQRMLEDRQITVRAFYYQLQAKALIFEENIRIPSLQVEEHVCYSTDDIDLSPAGNLQTMPDPGQETRHSQWGD